VELPSIDRGMSKLQVKIEGCKARTAEFPGDSEKQARKLGRV
jgi:hypothetical protein